MNNTEFKKLVGKTLKEKGFSYEKKVYYLRSDELIVCIDFQKSNFDNSYFINYGFLLTKLNPTMEYPKPNVSDVSGRFSYYEKEVVKPEFTLDFLNEEDLAQSIQMNLEKNIQPVIEDGLVKYFEINPQAKFVAKLNVKQYLGIE